MAFGLTIYNSNGILTFTNEPCFYVNKGTSSSGTRPSGVTGKIAVRATNSSANVYRNLSNNFVTSDSGTYDWVELIPVSTAIPTTTYGLLIKNPYNTVVFDSNRPSPTISFNGTSDFSSLSQQTVTLSTVKTNLKYYIAEDSLQMCVFNKTLNSSTNVRIVTFTTSSNIATLGISPNQYLYPGGEGNYTRGVIVPILIFQA